MCTITGGKEKAKDNPMDRAPRLLTSALLCQARNRAGKPCRCPAMRGKARCRLHGGASGSGAPQGEPNGMWRHGGYTSEAIALRQAAIGLIRALRDAESERKKD